MEVFCPQGKLTFLHLGNQILVEESFRRLVKRAVDGDNVALRQHLLQALDAAAANFLLLLRRKRLVVVVKQLLAFKSLEATEDPLANAADADGTDDFTLQVVLLFRHGGHVPFAPLDLLMGRDKVADKDKDRHQGMLRHRDYVAARHLGHDDAAVGLVGGIQINMIGPDASRDGNLEFLSLGQAFRREIARMEAN